MYVSIFVQTGKLYTYALKSNISVTLSFKYFLSKIKRRHKWGILKQHILLEQTTDNIHLIPESLKIKVGASYRLRMDGNNNTDISNNLYVMGNVSKITKCLYGCFYFNLCKTMGPVYSEICL